MRYEETYFGKMDRQIRENWIRYMELDGIGKRYSLEEFYAEMQSDFANRKRAMNLIEAKVPSTLTIASLLKGGMTNYFIVSDVCEGVTCEKCNSFGAIILLLDKGLKSNLENKVFLPALEYYYVLGIEPESDELLRHPPVPINPDTDYWYCPYCNEMHKFNYDNKKGLIYDQEVVEVKVDMDKHLKENKELAMLEEMFDKWKLFKI